MSTKIMVENPPNPLFLIKICINRVRIVASHFAKCEVIFRFGNAKIFF